MNAMDNHNFLEKTHHKTQTEWEDEMALKILDFTRNELYLDLRFFHVALSSLIPKPNSTLKTFASDGICLYYCTEQVLRVFKKNPVFLSRAYLHSILHCIFTHLWMTGNREQTLWNLACDIAVEYVIDHIDKPSTRRILSWLRSRTYQMLADQHSYISAPVIYRTIRQLDSEMISSLQVEFYTDDHRFWYSPNTAAPLQQKAQEQWNKIASQVKIQQEQQGKNAEKGERFVTAQIKALRSRRNYGEFLKKFSVLREELHIDPDEFDLNYYTYGLQLYGNLPLIESVETREIKKIREFVIVIDTSDSTSGQLVKNFLRETFQILHQREHFFSACKIRILQCDNQIRSDQEIQNLDQFESFLSQFTIIGGGGTNFCPAFAYVNQLIEQNVFQNLSGLLYFTDGQGIYPKKCPSYQTAFLFLNDYDESSVPPWAMRLHLEPEEFDTPIAMTGAYHEY